jgi:hypothetical protein
MKYSTLLLLLGATQAIRPSEDVDLQLDLEANARATVRQTLQNQLRAALNRGDAWPGVILPGSEPVMPVPSAQIDLQLEAEATERMTTRQQVSQQLRSFLESHGADDTQLVQVNDDEELTVEAAKEQAAKMQAEMDAAVAAADAKRAEQQRQFE